MKIFGDIHGHLHELRRLWVTFGAPENLTTIGDLTDIPKPLKYANENETGFLSN